MRDVDAEGKPATVIPTSQIRELMADRAVLIKAQKRLTKASVRGTLAASGQARGNPSLGQQQLCSMRHEAKKDLLLCSLPGIDLMFG